MTTWPRRRRSGSSNLHELRTRSGRSGTALARRADIDPATVLSYEHGVAMPQAGSVIALCGALDVTPDDLVAGIRWSPRREVLGPSAFRVIGEDALRAELDVLRAAIPRGRGGRGR